MAKDGITIPIRGEVDTKQIQRQLKDVQRNVNQLNSNPIIAKNFTQPLGRITGSADEFTKSLEASNARVVAFGASAGAIYALERALSLLVSTTIEVEQAFTNIRALTNSTNRDFKKLGDGLFSVAKDTGLAFKDVAESAEEFARQGLGVEKTLQRTNAALTLSRLGAMDSVKATESLTAALNTFGSSVSDATTVVNKLAQVDAEFAVSSGDLAEAIKRTGSSALGAKVSFEELLAVVTVAQERTARGGAVIGNSFKTIFTRIQRPEVLNQLELIGVKVRETNGEILPAINILRQYAKVYETLTPSLKSNTAELLAGVFQVNVLKSVLPELANETGKFDAALKTANETTNEASQRLKTLTETTKGTLNATVANLQQTASEIGNLTIKPAIDNVLKGLSELATSARPENFFGLGESVGKGIYQGIGKVLSGPGLIVLAAVISKIGVNLFKFVKDASQSFLGLNKAAQDHAALQGSIQQYLIDRPDQLAKILAKEKSIDSVAKDYTNELKQQKKLYKELLGTSSKMASNQQIIAAAGTGRGLNKKTNKNASGLIPNFVPNFAADADAERNAAKRGGYQAGGIRRMNVDGVGKVTYNGNETVKRFSGLQQPAIMPPALSEAGKDYRQKFQKTLGFDPYNQSALGFIPNFSFQPQASIKLPSGGAFKAASSLTRAIKGNRVTLTKEDKDHLNDIGYTAHVSGRKKQADAKAQRQKAADKIETYPVPINGKIGMLALNAGSAKRDVTVALRRIPALKQFINQNPELNNDKASFTGFEVKTLGDGFGKSAKQADEFFNQMSVQLASPLAALAAGFSKKILNNDGIDSQRQKELANALRGKDYLSPSMEGEIFEQVARLVTSDPKYLANAFDGNTDFQAPFDFEEIGKATPTFKKTFGFNRRLLKADAKRTASGDQIDSLVKKSFNQAVLAPNDLGGIFGARGDLALPLVGGKVRGKKFKDKDLKAAQAKVKSDLGLASGFVPNFSMDAISKAIEREDRAGVRRDKVRVGYDARLKKSGGIGVFNTDEGSLANAIDMHLASGRNMTSLQTQGKAEGFIPNFATRDPKTGRFVKASEQASKSLEKLGSAGDMSSGKLIGFSIALPIISSFTAKLQESESETTKALGAMATKGLEVGSIFASVGFALSTFGVDLKSVATKVITSFASFRTALNASTLATQLNATRSGAQGVGNLVQAGIFGAANNRRGFGGNVRNIGSSFSSGFASNRFRDSAGRFTSAGTTLGSSKLGKLTAKLSAGFAKVAKNVGGLIGPIAKFGSVVARLAGPIAVASGIITGAVVLYKKFTKAESERAEKQKKITKDLEKSTEQSAAKYETAKSAIERLNSTVGEYIQSLKEEDSARTQVLRNQIAADLAVLRTNGRVQFSTKQIFDELQEGSTKTLSKVKEQVDSLRAAQVGGEKALKAILEAAEKAEPGLFARGAAKLNPYGGFIEINKEAVAGIATFESTLLQLVKTLDDAGLEKLIDITRASNSKESIAQIEEAIDALKIPKSQTKVIKDVLAAFKSDDFKNLTLPGGSQDIFGGLVYSLQNLANEQRKAREEGALSEAARKKLTNAEADLRKALEATNKSLKDVVAQQLLYSKSLDVVRQFEKDRQSLIDKGATDFFSKTASKFVTENLRTSQKLQAIQKDSSNKRSQAQEALQGKLLKIASDNLEKAIDATRKEGSANSFTLENIQNSVSPLIDEIVKVIQSGGDLTNLNSQVDAVAKNLGFSAEALRQFKIDLQRGLNEPIDEFKNRMALLALETEKLSVIERQRQLEAIKTLQLEQKLNFAREGALAPRKFTEDIRQARRDVTFGRRTGDADRETSGLVALAKTFRGFSLGTDNPSQQLFLGQLTKRFEENMKTALSSQLMPGQRINEQQLEAIKDAALRQAEAIIRPDKVTEDNTKAVQDNTAALQATATPSGGEPDPLLLQAIADQRKYIEEQTTNLKGVNKELNPEGWKNLNRNIEASKQALKELQLQLNKTTEALKEEPSSQPPAPAAPAGKDQGVPTLPGVIPPLPMSKIDSFLRNSVQYASAGGRQMTTEGTPVVGSIYTPERQIKRDIKRLSQEEADLTAQRAATLERINRTQQEIARAEAIKAKVGDKTVADVRRMRQGAGRLRIDAKQSEATGNSRADKIRAEGRNFLGMETGGVSGLRARKAAALRARREGAAKAKKERERAAELEAKANALEQDLGGKVGTDSFVGTPDQRLKELNNRLNALEKTLKEDNSAITNVRDRKSEAEQKKIANQAAIRQRTEEAEKRTREAAMETAANRAQLLANLRKTGSDIDAETQERLKLKGFDNLMGVNGKGVNSIDDYFSRLISAAAKAPSNKASDDFTNITEGFLENFKSSLEAGVARSDAAQNFTDSIVKVKAALAEFDKSGNEQDLVQELGAIKERNNLNKQYNTASLAADQARFNFGQGLISSTELQAAAQEKLNNSYQDGEKYTEALSESIEAMLSYGTADRRRDLGELTKGVVGEFREATKSAFKEGITGAKSLREVLKGVFDRVADKAFDDAIDIGVNSLFGFFGGKKDGGSVKKFASGGMVSGGSGVRDDIPAFLQSGEYVIRKSSVNKYGHDFLDTINRRGVSGYQKGGRAFNQTLRYEFAYGGDNLKRPTSGSFNRSSKLSAFAIMDSNNPMAMLAFERERLFEQYKADFAAYEEQKRAAMKAFKRQQRSTLIKGAVAGVVAGIGELSAAANTPEAVAQEAQAFQDAGLPLPDGGPAYSPSFNKNGGLIKAFARGGMSRDNVPALLMGGEYVVNKQSVDKYGVNFFDGINKGRLPRFQEGGAVGMAESAGTDAPLNNTNNFSININIDQSGTASASNDPTDQGASQNTQAAEEEQERNKRLGERIQTVVQAELVDQLRPGGLLYNDKRI